jgi:hypothetical protein
MPFARAYQFVTPGPERLLTWPHHGGAESVRRGWQIIRHAASDLRQPLPRDLIHAPR